MAHAAVGNDVCLSRPVTLKMEMLWLVALAVIRTMWVVVEMFRNNLQIQLDKRRCASSEMALSF